MTEISPLDPERLGRITPDRLARGLREAGWRVAGERRDVYQRLVPPGSDPRRDHAILIPLDSTAPEYGELMNDAMAELVRYRDVWSSIAGAQAASGAADAVMARSAAEAPAGMIDWRAGERLFAGLGNILRAGAKAFVAPLPLFGSRHGRFANTFLDSVLMGQTGAGSFVVTAYAPSRQAFTAPRTTYEEEGAAELADANLLRVASPQRFSVRGRDITRSVARALYATTDALDEARNGAGPEAFSRRVPDGVSLELTRALGSIAADAPETDITIGWDPDVPAEELPSAFSFTRADHATLEQAQRHLALPGPAEPIAVTGYPYNLRHNLRQRGGDREIIDIEVVYGSGARRLRARFAFQTDVDRVVEAIRNGHAIRVTGDQVREGTTYWLHDARLSAVLSGEEPHP